MTEQKQEMVLVPRHPTKEMIEAAWADAHGEDALGVWRSMIEAWLKQEENRKGDYYKIALPEGMSQATFNRAIRMIVGWADSVGDAEKLAIALFNLYRPEQQADDSARKRNDQV